MSEASGSSPDSSAHAEQNSDVETTPLPWKLPLGCFAFVLIGVIILLTRLERAGFAMTVVSCLVLSIAALAALVSLQICADSRLSRLKIEGPDDCEYCTGKARVICNDCKLVQWKKLKGTGAFLFWAGLLVSNRWQISAATLSFVLVSSISLCVHANDTTNRNAEKVIEQERTEREARLNNALKAAEAGSAFRGALLMIEATCSSPRSADCAGYLTTLRENYYRYSLQAPALVYEFSKLCDSSAHQASDARAHDTPEPANAGAVRASRTSMCALVKGMTHGSMIDELNKDFRRYMNLVASCSADDVACTLKRRERALVLYENGRMAQCALAEVSYEAMFYGKPKPFITYQRCAEPAWLSEAPKVQEGELNWLGWPAVRDNGANGPKATPPGRTSSDSESGAATDVAPSVSAAIVAPALPSRSTSVATSAVSPGANSLTNSTSSPALTQ